MLNITRVFYVGPIPTQTSQTHTRRVCFKASLFLGGFCLDFDERTHERKTQSKRKIRSEEKRAEMQREKKQAVWQTGFGRLRRRLSWLFLPPPAFHSLSLLSAFSHDKKIFRSMWVKSSTAKTWVKCFKLGHNEWFKSHTLSYSSHSHCMAKSTIMITRFLASYVILFVYTVNLY